MFRYFFLNSRLLLGPPGAGKSTSGQLLGRNHGYVYYEADCFGMFANPFVDLHANDPSLEIARQKPLKVCTPNFMYINSYKKSVF